MTDPVQELKIRAEILHTRLASSAPEALDRLRALPELRRATAEALAFAASSARYKHCLAVVAREHGFSGWEHACRVLRGDARETDFGTLLYNERSGGSLNRWFTSYDESRAFLDESRSGPVRYYQLAYRAQLFVVERQFIEDLGLDPDDADWEAIDWDWARPKVPVARQRLYQKRLAALRAAS
jgi:hypothetical protein